MPLPATCLAVFAPLVPFCLVFNQLNAPGRTGIVDNTGTERSKAVTPRAQIVH